MTREEAHYQIDIQCSEGKHGIIDEIYDDFESRTCENCKHYNSYKETPSKGICSQLGVHNIGGCGDYFERKEK